MEGFSFTQTVNNFIDSLDKHQDSIEVVNVSPDETIIYFEDYEHEPIINYNSVFSQQYKDRNKNMSKNGLSNLGRKLSKEHKEAIANGKKGRKLSAEHSASIAQAKREYYKKLKEGKN